jgi:hypothetical protein
MDEETERKKRRPEISVQSIGLKVLDCLCKEYLFPCWLPRIFNPCFSKRILRLKQHFTMLILVASKHTYTRKKFGSTRVIV